MKTLQIFAITTIALVIAKLVGLLDWSWMTTLAPIILLVISGIIVFIGLCALFALVCWMERNGK